MESVDLAGAETLRARRLDRYRHDPLGFVEWAFPWGEEGGPLADRRVDAARQKTAQQLGTAQARLAAQGSDLAGSPLDVLGDIAAAGEEDALSPRYQSMRTAWENRARASLRPLPMGHYERVAARPVDPTLGIVRPLLS